MSSSRESNGPYIERLEARAYSRATEIPERVTRAILNIFPENIQKQVSISESKVEGHQGLPILIIKGILSDQGLVEEAAKYMFQNLPVGDIKEIQNSLDRRIDEDCTFFLRIDKQEAYLERIELAMNPDVISIQISIRNLPRCSTDDAKDLIRHLISLSEVLSR